MIVYQCEDSLESIFTAIYNSYQEHRDHNDTRICLDQEYYLFAEYVPVTADREKAAKVIRTLKRRFGEADYQSICYALSAPDGDKAQAVYQTIVKGLAKGTRQGHLLDNLTDDDCNRAFALSRAAGREANHLYGFLRFEEVQNGILYAKIGPKNNLLTFLMPHFADRFPMENFIIYDDKRNLFAVHPAGQEWYLMSGQGLHLTSEQEGESTSEGETEYAEEGTEQYSCSNQKKGLVISDKEQQIQELFRHFCRSIAIKERENRKLQQNMLPLRFQEYMLEFK